MSQKFQQMGIIRNKSNNCQSQQKRSGHTGIWAIFVWLGQPLCKNRPLVQKKCWKILLWKTPTTNTGKWRITALTGFKTYPKAVLNYLTNKHTQKYNCW